MGRFSCWERRSGVPPERNSRATDEATGGGKAAAQDAPLGGQGTRPHDNAAQRSTLRPLHEGGTAALPQEAMKRTARLSTTVKVQGHHYETLNPHEWVPSHHYETPDTRPPGSWHSGAHRWVARNICH